MNPLRWRKMTWAILVFGGLMVAWMIAGTSTEVCGDYAPGTADREACELGEDIGTGIGVAAIFFLWFIGFVILSIVWFMTRPRHRQCPRCGEDVKKGLTACGECGYDFAAVLAPTSSDSNAQTLRSISASDYDPPMPTEETR